MSAALSFAGAGPRGDVKGEVGTGILAPVYVDGDWLVDPRKLVRGDELDDDAVVVGDTGDTNNGGAAAAAAAVDETGAASEFGDNERKSRTDASK
jgi:hypothetical protein